MDLLNIDFSPLVTTLKTAIVVTIIAFGLGMLMARWVLKANRTIQIVVDTMMTLPMVLPPTVIGFFLLILFSRKRPLGIFLEDYFGIQVVQTWAGCILAAFCIAFPLMYKNAKSAFEQLDWNLIFAARTLGMSEWNIFWKIIFPLSGPGIGSGTVLTFARAMGEYGATVMIAGNIPGKTATISQKIAVFVKDGDYQSASVQVLIVMGIAAMILLLMNGFAKNTFRQKL